MPHTHGSPHTQPEINSMPQPSVTHHDIIAGLQQLGILHGAMVEVHSSLRAFGWVEDGAQWETADRQGLIRHGSIGQADCHYFKARSVVSIYKRWRQADPYGLYDGVPPPQ
jgi:aminoglycoside N3'-acetyltransferase